MLVWLNMGSSAKINQLYAERKEHGVLTEELQPLLQPAIRCADPRRNRFRVFYDIGSDDA